MFLATAASRGPGRDTRGIGVIVAASSMFVAMVLAIFVRMAMIMFMVTIVLDSRGFACMIGMRMALFSQAGMNMLSLGSATRCTHGFAKGTIFVRE
jgi:hypothetical protein